MENLIKPGSNQLSDADKLKVLASICTNVRQCGKSLCHESLFREAFNQARAHLPLPLFFASTGPATAWMTSLMDESDAEKLYLTQRRRRMLRKASSYAWLRAKHKMNKPMSAIVTEVPHRAFQSSKKPAWISIPKQRRQHIP